MLKLVLGRRVVICGENFHVHQSLLDEGWVVYKLGDTGRMLYD